MAKVGAERPRKRITDQTYVAPFGRYQAGGEVEPPADEVLVGRESQRALFIDLLLRGVRRGAYLITGHRGVGKTSFVRHCLKDYRDEVFERFLHSNVGRSIFWDRMMVVGLGLVALFLAMMASELMDLLLRFSSGQHTPGHFFVWFLIVLLAIPCLYPLLFAREIIGEIFEASGTHERRERINAAMSTTLTVLIVLACWYRGSFGNPVLSLSRLMLATAVLYLWCQLTSLRSRGSTGRPTVLKVLDWLGLGAFCLLVFIPWLPGTGNSDEVTANVTLALALVGWAGFLFGFGKLYHRRRTTLGSYPEFLKEGKSGRVRLSILWRTAPQEDRLAIREDIIAAGTPWYSLPGFLLSAGAMGYLFDRGLGWHLAAIVGTLLLSIPPFLLVLGRSDRFRPQVTAVFYAKTLLCVVVSLHLVFPVLARWEWPEVLAPFDSALSRLSDGGEGSLCFQAGACAASDRASGSEPSLFHDREEEIRYVLLLFGCLGLIYFLEYEWIVRPFLPQRRDRAIDPALAKAGGSTHFKNLAKMTMPWQLYKMWLPIIMVAVNLGFDKLDHRRVVQSMLIGLRSQYHRTFLSWNSAIANMGRLLRLMVVLMIVVWAGERGFALPDLPAMNGRSSYSDICDRFRGGQTEPGAVNLICKLEHGSSVFHVLYYDFVGPKAKQAYESRDEHILFYVLPFAVQEWPQGSDRPLIQPGIHFRVYHLLLLVTLLLLGRWVTGRLPVPAYRSVLRQIDEVIDSLTAVTSVTSRVRYPGRPTR
jgi:hypothetical protein